MVGMVAALTLPGCSASHKAAAQTSATRWAASPGSAALVLPSPEIVALEGPAADATSPMTWEYARLDPLLGAADAPFITVAGAAQIRHYEWLRDVNGQPRNDSWTFSRSTQTLIQP